MAASDTTGGGFVREALHNRRLLGVALIAAIGGFLFGYDTGVIGGAMLFMQKDLGLKTHGQQQLAVGDPPARRDHRRADRRLGGGQDQPAAHEDHLRHRLRDRRRGLRVRPDVLADPRRRFWLGLAVGCASFVVADVHRRARPAADPRRRSSASTS